MNKKSNLTIYLFAVLITGALLVTQGSVLADDIEVPNFSFEDAGPITSASGAPTPIAWKFTKWKGADDEVVPAGLSTDAHYDGKQSLFVGAVKNGAAGWSSKSFPLAAPADIRLSVRIKLSDDFAGNVPWIFIAWFKSDGTFVNKSDAKIPSGMTPGDWNEVVLDVRASEIPEGADHFVINLTGQHNEKSGDNVAGQVNFDDVKLSVSDK